MRQPSGQYMFIVYLQLFIVYLYIFVYTNIIDYPPFNMECSKYMDIYIYIFFF